MEERTIVINGLFGRHRIELDLNRRCIIFIGENGIGKSTILKIVDSISRFDFITLSSFQFDSIEFFVGNQAEVLVYNELFSYNSRFYEWTAARYGFNYFEDIDKILNLSSENDDSQKMKWFYIYHFLKFAETKGDKAVYDLLSSCYHSRPLPIEFEVEYELINSYFHQSNFYKGCIKDEIKSILDAHIIHSDVELSSGEYVVIRTFVEVALAEGTLPLKAIYDLDLEKFMFVDMVNLYKFDTTIYRTSNVMENGLRWLTQYNNKLVAESRMLPIPYSTSSLIGIPDCEAYMRKYLRKIAREAYLNPHIQYEYSKKSAEFNFIKKFKEEHVVDLGILITSNYYTEEFIKEINEEAVPFFIDMIGYKSRPALFQNDQEEKEATKFLQEISTNHIVKNYVVPVLYKNHVFENVYIGRAIHPSQSKIANIELAFYRFYKAICNKLLTYQNVKISKMKQIANKYITNKYIDISPVGIIISKSSIHSGSGISEIYVDIHNDITTENLSSGEKKLLLLLALGLYFDEYSLLIDEPELSLSISWQERILPDLLDNTLIKNLFVATHSPFIACDESLSDFISPLPMN